MQMGNLQEVLKIKKYYTYILYLWWGMPLTLTLWRLMREVRGTVRPCLKQTNKVKKETQPHKVRDGSSHLQSQYLGY